MSAIVSRRPSFLNHSNEAFWMSIRLGRSRTCFRREKLLRARGATAVLLKLLQPPLWLRAKSECGQSETADVGATPKGSESGPPAASKSAAGAGVVLRV